MPRRAGGTSTAPTSCFYHLFLGLTGNMGIYYVGSIWRLNAPNSHQSPVRLLVLRRHLSLLVLLVLVVLVEPVLRSPPSMTSGRLRVPLLLSLSLSLHDPLQAGQVGTLKSRHKEPLMNRDSDNHLKYLYYVPNQLLNPVVASERYACQESTLFGRYRMRPDPLFWMSQLCYVVVRSYCLALFI